MDGDVSAERQHMYRRRWFVRVVRVLLARFRNALVGDVRTIVRHVHLMGGITCAFIGLLSFSSDRYCDGNTSIGYACTRPSTYYFYPWWAILLVVFGAVGVSVWYVRMRVSSS